MKNLRTFKQIDKELELLNKEAEQELNHIKTHYHDITKSLSSISTVSGIITGFLKKEAISRFKKQLSLKKRKS